jgi:hypothetical protein
MYEIGFIGRNQRAQQDDAILNRAVDAVFYDVPTLRADFFERDVVTRERSEKLPSRRNS